MINFNQSNNLNFNVVYDKQENLPPNDWKECIFQKWCFKTISDNGDIAKDLLNGFKIYKTLNEAKFIVGNLFSNMYLIPYIARNFDKDINISQKIPYALSNPNKNTFSKEVIAKRLAGNEERKKLLDAKKNK